jgi:hypothetical protein
MCAGTEFTLIGDTRCLWEQRFARQALREQQRRVDEIAIFSVLDQQQAIVADAARATRSSRRRSAPVASTSEPQVKYDLPAEELESELLGQRR